ncbi:MAG: DUF58 domain-containing protein [Chthoniobacterales bacterium]
MPLLAMADSLFPEEFLKQLEGLHLLARQVIRGRMRAERRSLKRGAGLEFSDYRPFVSGDDIKSIDWAAFARSRHLLLKLFEEEEDLPVHVLLDASVSMDFGSPSKFDLARRLSAGLAFLALANLDRVGIALVGNPSLRNWAPSRGRAKFFQLLEYLRQTHTGGGAVPLADAVRLWLATKPQRGLVIWITDLYGRTLDDALLALDRIRYSRHEIGVIQIRAADELQAGNYGEFDLSEVESGEVRPVIIDRAVARAYEAKVEEYQERVARYCRRYGIALMVADAGESAADILKRSLLEGGFVR